MEEQKQEERLIFHVDMDAFFAAVEQRDHPKWKGKPVIVGGTTKRGVVATASYEARVYGVHSAMSSVKAHSLCPHGIFVKGNFARYQYFSNRIFELLGEYTDVIQQVSIDEGYLDMTGKTNNPLGTAEQIRNRVYKETGLTLSVGISFNKFLAKIASDWNKPNGSFLISKEAFQQLLDPLPIIKVHGLGKKTEGRLNRIGIHTICQLRDQSEEFLRTYLGNSFGEMIYQRIRGIDDRPVREEYSRKSYGKETTFSEDTKDPKQIEVYLRGFSEKIAGYLQKNNKLGSTVCLKIKYEDFETHTRSKTLSKPTNRESVFFETASKLLREDISKKVRLIGLSISNLEELTEEQLTIWEYIDEDRESYHKKTYGNAQIIG